MNFRVILTPPDAIKIVKTKAPVDVANNVFASHRSAKAAVHDLVDARIRTLRRTRDEAVAVPEAKLESDEPAMPAEAA